MSPYLGKEKEKEGRSTAGEKEKIHPRYRKKTRDFGGEFLSSRKKEREASPCRNKKRKRKEGREKNSFPCRTEWSKRSEGKRPHPGFSSIP